MAIENQNAGRASAFSWAVAVFAARETPHELRSTLDAIVEAANAATVIDVMVNGNAALAAAIAQWLGAGKRGAGPAVVRVWSIALGDKAHAWNQYVHAVWPGAPLSFFVDGYVRLKPDALALLAAGMAASPGALGGTGVPTSGRTAAKLRQHMLAEGGMHGNLFVLTEAVMERLRQSRFHLPLGIYRTDSTLGAALAFGLDPSQYPWDIKNRVFVHPDASWTTEERKWWRYAEVKSQLKRLLRQSQGVLENLAVEDFLAHRKLAPADLPRTASELVLEWVERCPDKAGATLSRSPLSRIALKKFRAPRDWSAAEEAPALIGAWPGGA